jgi:hypothetical protein
MSTTRIGISFTLALATRSGAAPRIPALATRSGAAPRIPALATRSRAAPRISIYSPDVGNMLAGCASHWYLFARCWQHARGLRLTLVFICPALATRSGAALYAVNLSSLLNHRRCSVYCVDFSSTYSGLSTTWPTASIRQRHRLQQAFDNIITMIQPLCDSANHDMQELHLVPHATCKTMTLIRLKRIYNF